MSKIKYSEMGKRIKDRREKNKITQALLAEKIDVAPSYISEIERGTSICSLAVLVKIADELDLNLDYLVRGINSSNADNTFKDVLKTMPKENHKLFMELCNNIANTLSNK